MVQVVLLLGNLKGYLTWQNKEWVSYTKLNEAGNHIW
jgi:hypothetical protein